MHFDGRPHEVLRSSSLKLYSDRYLAAQFQIIKIFVRIIGTFILKVWHNSIVFGNYFGLFEIQIRLKLLIV